MQWIEYEPDLAMIIWTKGPFLPFFGHGLIRHNFRINQFRVVL